MGGMEECHFNQQGAVQTFMSTSVQFCVAQAFSSISKMATVLRFMTSTSHRPMVSPARQNRASSSCSSDHWGSLLASSYIRAEGKKKKKDHVMMDYCFSLHLST